MYIVILFSVALITVLEATWPAPRLKRSAFYTKQYSLKNFSIQGEEKPMKTFNEIPFRPHVANAKEKGLTFDPAEFMCGDKSNQTCQEKTSLVRDIVLNEFRKGVNRTNTNDTNYYHVEYGASKAEVKTTAYCRVYDAKVRTLSRKDPPFDRNAIGAFFPDRKLFTKRDRKAISTCAIISSAGSLKHSKLGLFIDSHDVVMRFNHAPTDGYEQDVGRKTTIRLLNSQVVSKPEFNFLTSKIFQNIHLAAWDPGRYNDTLESWIQAPDHDIFHNYQMFRAKYPKANFHLVNPVSIWRLWEKLQDFTDTPIIKNPPSSGFIGLALLLPVCEYIDFIEYIPSTRLKEICHYYDDEQNPGCTFGSWHPLAAEKLMVYSMNTIDDFSVFQNGIVRIRKTESDNCGK